MAEQLPEPPMMVLAKQPFRKVARWHYRVDLKVGRERVVLFVEMNSIGVAYKPHELRVITDTRNDPRAVELIQNSKEGM